MVFVAGASVAGAMVFVAGASVAGAMVLVAGASVAGAGVAAGVSVAGAGVAAGASVVVAAGVVVFAGAFGCIIMTMMMMTITTMMPMIQYQVFLLIWCSLVPRGKY
jgi:hypothetical protein